ncbi:MAG: glycosyltransferase family 4 protein [bacterium]
MGMRICMIATNDLLNDPRVRKEAESAVAAGFDVTVLGLLSSRTSPEELIDGYRIVRAGPHSLKSKCIAPLLERFLWRLGKFPSFWFSQILRNVLYLASEVTNHSADIYHANDLDTLWVACSAARRFGAKVVYDNHELWLEQPFVRNIPLAYSLGFLLEGQLIGAVDRVVVVNESIGRILKERYFIGDFTVVMNCPRLQSPDGRSYLGEELRRKVGGRRILLYQGRYEPGRGLEEIVRSMRFVEGGALVLRGYGVLEASLRGLVESLNLEDRVFFAPPVPMADLVDAAAEADLGLMPYRDTCLDHRYCTPNKLFEYMMAGLAVAASDLPEIRRILSESGAGEVFDPDDPRNIADVVNGIISDELMLKEMRRNAVLSARERYNWGVEAQKLIDTYISLVEEGR